jgi:hypothetical protein
MGFDQNDPRPVLNVKKKTTQVNIWMAIAVLMFFVAGGLAIWIYASLPKGG